TYQEFSHSILPGQVIVIGTDGIWESRNKDGHMFGKQRFHRIIKDHARGTAADLLQAVIAELDRFSHPLEKEDDVTLVVIKIRDPQQS
ncbi:MAG: SpoIIE family protein phosphatase, partial [Desulfobacterales bacterium]